MMRAARRRCCSRAIGGRYLALARRDPVQRKTMALILIVEDDPDIQHMLELLLTDAGHTVIGAFDGWRCLELALRVAPNLIVMDLALPKLDGWQTTQRLKANQLTQAIPVLALTANATDTALA